MTGLALIGAGAGVMMLLVGIIAFLAYRSGRAGVVAADDTTAIEVKNAQLQAAADRPATRAELADRLRRNDF